MMNNQPLVINWDLRSSGPCARRVVKATVVSPKGIHYVGTNYCRNPQTECPRGDLPSGVGYEMCIDICKQDGHAEVMALRYAGGNARGGVLYVEGHHYVCDNCKKVAEIYGIKEVILGSPSQQQRI